MPAALSSQHCRSCLVNVAQKAALYAELQPTQTGQGPHGDGCPAEVWPRQLCVKFLSALCLNLKAQNLLSVQYASLLNTFASFAAAPLIIQYSTASPIARVAVTTSVIAFAVITTGGLHWFTKPYVHQLWYSKQQQAVKAQTMSLLGGVKWRQFPIGSVTEFTGIHPMANFKVWWQYRQTQQHTSTHPLASR